MSNISNPIDVSIPKIGARVHPASDQDVPTTNYTQVVLATEDYDYGGCFAANKYTVGTAGIYLVVFHVGMSEVMGDGKLLAAAIYKGGTIHARTEVMASANLALTAEVTIVEEFAVLDELTFYVKHNYGSNREMEADDTFASVLLLAE